ncbi:DUF4037 domain-containing protein [Pseudactinotalea suaedae]|uniref:DUF4037 domain-containing protein n=1 Tax=Pseudactinotalea suaedae TaxID=1524924 RepID=UPI0012E239C7|nr:DUF4037 domain-containing protein [Pseudactinotalea suaedae]
MTADDQTGGADLSRAYYHDVVRPLLDARWPDLPHAAGRLGAGSDVLGLDDATSRDHDWGLRLSLLVPEDLVGPVAAHLDASLPPTYAGLPTRFAFTGATRAQHHIETTTLSQFLHDKLGLADLGRLSVDDWLSLTGQSVLEVSAGPVFWDTDGTLHAARRMLAWYPHDVWAYLVASCWIQLEEEMPLMGRAGQVGDERGSRLIGGRLALTVTRLAFLLHRTWAPYSKWLGTMFDRLPGSAAIGEHLDAALAADHWRPRQQHIARALDLVLALQEQAGLPAPAPATAPFWDRPFVFPNEQISGALLGSVTDPAVQNLPRGRGGIEQVSDNIAVLVDPAARRRMVSRV